MKNNVFFKIFLILIPIMALGLSTTIDSVMAFYPESGEKVFYSYFSLIPDVGTAMMLPLAGLLCLFSIVTAIIAVISRKDWCISGIKWLSFGAATAAVTPILLRGAVIVVPNVMFPFLMMIEFALTFLLSRKNEKEFSPGARLRR